jgi:hypothetical protein
MTHDWTADVKKYAPGANADHIKGIVKHCGIALQKRDSSFVACGDRRSATTSAIHFSRKNWR